MDKYDGLNEAMVRQFAPRPGRRELLPPMSEKAQVALLCRMIFNEGWNEHIAGHITYRLDNGNVLVFANRSYRILHGELTNVGVENPGPRAIDMLTLNRPELSWVDMAHGMGVEACRVADTRELARAIEVGLATSSPYLIEIEL